MSEASKKIERYARDLMAEMLAEVTPEQKEVFERMYISPECISNESMPWAFEQLERTIAHNKERGAKNGTE